MIFGRLFFPRTGALIPHGVAVRPRMKDVRIVFGAAAALTAAIIPARVGAVNAPLPPAQLEGLPNLPMSFVPNAGQWEREVKFMARGSRYSVSLLPTEAVLVLGQRVKSPPATPSAE